MSRLHEHLRQPSADQSGPAQHQHLHRSALPARPALRRVAVRALICGSVASVTSIAVATLCSRPRTGSAASASNAISHWIWGEPGRRRHSLDFRHTVLGYTIHHASSVFWAFAHEAALEHTRARCGRYLRRWQRPP